MDFYKTLQDSENTGGVTVVYRVMSRNGREFGFDRISSNQ